VLLEARLFTIAVIVAVLVALVVIFVALHKIKPESFTLKASALKWFTLELDMKLPGPPGLPPPKRRDRKPD
jgi:hypothetical protein